MNRWLTYAGPILVAAGAWLTTTHPHPFLGDAVVLGLLAAAVLVGLVGIVMGSQTSVGLSILAAMVPTFPPMVPASWLGAASLLAGAVFALEGARAHREEVPLPPLRAWGFPLGLVLVALVVPVAALTTQAGRESLDIAQGMGVAVTAPFLLGAAWLVLVAIDRRDAEQGEDEAAARSGNLAGVLLLGVAVLAAGALVAGVPSATATGHTCEDPRTADAFEACPEALRVQAHDEPLGENRTGETWELDASTALLIDHGFDPEDLRNMTFHDATLEVDLASQLDNTACSGNTLALERALGSWGEETNWTRAPDGEDPIRHALSDDDCMYGQTAAFNVTGHLQAWADGAPLHGWRLAADGGPVRGSDEPAFASAVYDTNGPRLVNATVTPDPVDGVTMVPMDGLVRVTTDLIDPTGNVKNATLRVGNHVALEATLHRTGETELVYEPETLTADGPLEMHVQDWDGNTAREPLTTVRPDHEAPNVDPGEDLERSGDRLVLNEPVPETTDRGVNVTITDDACAFVDPCGFVTVLDEDGHEVQNATVNQTHEDVTLHIPTNPPGDRALIIRAEDPAERVTLTRLDYAVSEPRAPEVTNLTLTDHLDREDQQEAGLPLTVTMDVTDESPPVYVNITDGDTRIGDTVLDAKDGSVDIAPTVETAGTRALVVTVEDRWGNQHRQTRTVEIFPQRAPVITLPDDEHVPSRATLEATFQDASLVPEDVTVKVLRGGSTLEAATVDVTLRPQGVSANVTLPELLHGEAIRLTATATDQAGLFATATSDHVLDARAPEIRVVPEPGAAIDGDLWTLPGAHVAIQAEDDASGLDDIVLVEPYRSLLDATGELIPVGGIGEEPIRVQATDRVGNQAEWAGQLFIDDTPPTVDVRVDGHDLLVNVTPRGSPLSSVTLTANDTPLSIPLVEGEHRVTVPGVTRGDEVLVAATVEDRVGHEATFEDTLIIQAAPPDVRISSMDRGNVTLTVDDPDGDPVHVTSTLTHKVNGTTWAFPEDATDLAFPNWRGDVELEVEATAHNASTTEHRAFTLGEGPHMAASLPERVGPGEHATIPVTWERDFAEVTLLVLDDERQVDLVNVTKQGPGKGEAVLTLDEEGTYDLELRAKHTDGTVTAQSVGHVEVSAGPNTAVITVGVLLLVAVMGLVLLYRYREDDQEPDEGSPPDARASSGP